MNVAALGPVMQPIPQVDPLLLVPNEQQDAFVRPDYNLDAILSKNQMNIRSWTLILCSVKLPLCWPKGTHYCFYTGARQK